VHVGVLVVPVGLSVVTSVLLARVYRRPHDLTGALVWWLAVLGSSTVVVSAATRVMRRVLPLTTLLKLTLVFPDRAPSRFRLALRATSRKHARRLQREERAHDSAGQEGETLLSLLAALQRHDRRTRGHSERVRAYALLLGEQLHLSQADRDRLQWAALLHDVGKLDVSPSILNKNGKPTEKEWAELRRHPESARQYLAPLQDYLGEWTSAADQHHERWDGAGYPLGLTSTEISVAGRIVAIADAFEVMTAARAYKRPMSALKAREELVRCAGAHFDPHYVRMFMEISLGRLLWVMGPLAWVSQFGPLGWLVRPETAVTFVRPVAAGSTLLAASAGLVAPSVLPVATPPAPATTATTTQVSLVQHTTDASAPVDAVDDADGELGAAAVPRAPSGRAHGDGENDAAPKRRSRGAQRDDDTVSASVADVDASTAPTPGPTNAAAKPPTVEKRMEHANEARAEATLPGVLPAPPIVPKPVTKTDPPPPPVNRQAADALRSRVGLEMRPNVCSDCGGLADVPIRQDAAAAT
jgi:HD domain